jgi:hypothetical protein
VDEQEKDQNVQNENENDIDNEFKISTFYMNVKNKRCG